MAVLSERGLGVEKKQLGKKTIAVQVRNLTQLPPSKIAKKQPKEITKVEGEGEGRRRGQRKNEMAVLSERGLGVEKKQLGKKTIAVQVRNLTQLPLYKIAKKQ